MARGPKTVADVGSIDEEMARVQQRLTELAEARKKALAAEADKGRGTLMAALAKVKIAEMSKDEAKAIARAFSTHGASGVAKLLTAK